MHLETLFFQSSEIICFHFNEKLKSFGIGNFSHGTEMLSLDQFFEKFHCRRGKCLNYNFRGKLCVKFETLILLFEK